MTVVRSNFHLGARRAKAPAAFISPLTFFKPPFFIALLLKIPLWDWESLFYSASQQFPQVFANLEHYGGTSITLTRAALAVKICDGHGNTHLPKNTQPILQTLDASLLPPFLSLSVLLRCKSLLGAPPRQKLTAVARVRYWRNSPHHRCTGGAPVKKNFTSEIWCKSRNSKKIPKISREWPMHRCRYSWHNNNHQIVLK